MLARRMVLATVLAAAILAAKSAKADYTMAPVPAGNWGVWDGWGVSLCWWAGDYGTQDDLADIVFSRKIVDWQGQTVPGLGLNIARYNAGASSWNPVDGSKMVASPRISRSRQMQGFWLNPESSDPSSGSWDWNADANQRAMLLKAKQRGANLFELFSNSPMWWMCVNHNPSGAANASEDNLDPVNYQHHAQYLATIARVARDRWGIKFTSVEPFNEPVTPYWGANGTQEGCHFKASSQPPMIDCLRTELNHEGLRSTMVSASDETSYDRATATWNSFDETTRRQVGRVNVHGYEHDGRRDLLYTAVAGKKLWNSEYGEDDASGLTLARNLTLDMRRLHPTAWCYWQAVDWGGWGLISKTGESRLGAVNPKFYVLAQFSRHIRPGMQILDSGDDNTIAAYDAKRQKLVLVTTNDKTPQTITYSLKNFAKADGPVTRWTTNMDTNTDHADRYVQRSDIPLGDKQFSCAFDANTVQTFEIENVKK